MKILEFQMRIFKFRMERFRISLEIFEKSVSIAIYLQNEHETGNIDTNK